MNCKRWAGRLHSIPVFHRVRDFQYNFLHILILAKCHQSNALAEYFSVVTSGPIRPLLARRARRNGCFLQLQKEQHFIARKIWYNVSASGGNGVNLSDVCSVSGTLSYATCHAVAVSQCDNILPLLSWWLAFFATSISRSYQSTGFMALFNVPHSTFSKLPHYNFICYGHWCDTYFDFFFPVNVSL